ncbi:PAS domain-containing protein [Paucibacter sp. AS339]|uniref:PAS domain-containing protein n=1 Tax=Paucibacter hankyongi TaxID=3133434 RepID=UPI0030B54286
MLSAPARLNEAASLAALHGLDVLDSPPEPAFDALVRVASLVCGVPISLISLIDAERQWFKANIGLPGVTETPRELAFCAHAVLGDELFDVPDASLDPRFADNPLVTGGPDIRFYAGAPICLSDGIRVGTLCVIDRQPHHLNDTQREVLRQLAASAAQALEGRRAIGLLQQSAEAAQHTERVLAEERLRLHHIIDSSNAGTWEWNVQTGEVRINARWAEIIGWSPQDLAPLSFQSWLDRVHPDDLEPTRERLAAHFSGQTPHYTAEFRLRHRDGHWVWTADNGCVMTWTPDGRAEWMFGTHQDISERMLEKQALAAAGDRIALAADSGGIGIWDWSFSSGSLAWDDWMYRLYGLVPHAQPASVDLWLSRVHPEDKDMVEQAVQDSLHGKRPYELEFRTVWPDGSVHFLRGTARMKRDEQGHALRLVGANWDVSEARQRAADLAEQHRQYVARQQELDRMKSEFLSLAAHELRTPMTSIFGFTELMIEREMPAAKQQVLLGRIHRQSKLMISILNELLDLSRIEARGAADFKFESLDLADVVGATVADFKPPEGREPPQLSALAEALPVHIDRQKMQQILLNTLSNAYKYSPDGGPVTLRLLKGSRVDGRLEFGVEVRDEGIGLSAESLARIGERFFRADTSGQFPGTGLGVSISRELLELMGGRMEIASQLGQGCTVKLWL